MKNKSLSKLFITILSFSFLLGGCGSNTSGPDYSNDQRYQIYQLAVADGYTGTYEEWLASIKGKDGQDGHTPVITIGENGNWFVDNVDTGVKARGEDGKDGQDGQPGKDGSDGQPGKDGVDGKDGQDGTSVLTGNGTPNIDLGKIGDSYIDLDNWNYYVKNENGWEYKGNIKGQDGKDGQDGSDGQPGQDGKSAYELYCKAHPEYHGTKQEWLDDLINGRLGNKEVHTVTFDSQGGSKVSSQEIIHGEKAVKPDNPTKEGYDFVDWVDNNNDHWVFNGYSITSDITLYAVWKAAEYTITLNPNGGTVSQTSLEVAYLESFVLPTPTRDGYTFTGWCLDNQVFDSSIYNYTHDITLTAKWNAPFTIHFNSNGGSDVDDYLGYLEDEVITLPTPTKDGNQFLGWYYNDVLVEAPFVYNYDGLEVTFVAKWKEVSGDYDLQALDDNTVMIIGYSGNDTELVIPSTMNGKSVVSISDEVFKGKNTITKIVLPNTVTSLGNEVFANITSLDEVVLSNSLATVGENILLGSSNLTKLTMCANNILLKSFFDYEDKNIPNNLVLTLSYKQNTYVAPASGVFKNLSNNTKFSVVLDDSWVSIPGSAFSQCALLTSISIPDSVTSIGSYAFCNCTSLTSITIADGVTSISSYAFYNCTSLTSVNIPDGVTSIAYATFYNCTSLTTITIPDSVTSIGSSAFYNCTSLTSIVIPNSVTSIGSSAFYNCTSLTSVNIPDGVTSIEEYAFAHCTSLTSVNIPDGVTSIGILAFAHCTSLTSVNIPDGVTSIGSSAFYNCSSLTSITIPDSVTSIDNGAFQNCSSIRDVFYTGTKAQWNNIEIGNNNTYLINANIEYNSEIKVNSIVTNKYSYVLTSDNKVLDFKMIDRTITSFDFEEELPGLMIVSLGNYAFQNCTSLTSIVIPDSVTLISEGAFYGCSSLTSIVIPDSVTSIDDHAFYNCTSLTSISISDSVISIGDHAFRYCTSLTSISIPDGVTSIGKLAFENCTSLTSITIPNSVTSISYATFYKCSSLTSIVIPDSVISIGDYAFYECLKLTSIVIPNSVISIGDYAFYECLKLTSIVIPNSVTSIGNGAFQMCTSLTSITFVGTMKEWNLISKGNAWRDSVPATVVHCSDSDVNI